MRAVWYEHVGAAHEVLVYGEMPDCEPGPGEVRVRIMAAGLNPRDTKRRGGVGDRAMTDKRVIPGDDGAGIVDRVGDGVPAARVGERVWVHSATFGRPFGTSAEYVVVPQNHAVRLPATTAFAHGACLGVPALTAHRCLYADGPVDGLVVLVTGGAGAVGRYAVQLAKHGGAHVIATASTEAKRNAAFVAGADRVIDYRRPDAVAAILRAAGGQGVDRVVDVAFGANLPMTAGVVAPNGTIVGYGSDAVPQPAIPFYSLMRRSITIRTVLVFAMPPDALAAATEMVTELLAARSLLPPSFARYPLEACADAHARLEAGELTGKALILP